jgi:Rieske Fe-S protein
MNDDSAEALKAEGAGENVRPFDVASDRAEEAGGAKSEAGLPARRDFLKLGILGAAGIIASTAVYPLVGLAERSQPPKPIMFADALPLSDMPEVGVKKIALYFTPGGKADARVFIKRGPDGKLTAFSAVCTHLGCIVNYDRLKDRFICPCHGGVYDGNGNNVAGPPPAPLTKLPVQIVGEYIQVGIPKPPSF